MAQLRLFCAESQPSTTQCYALLAPRQLPPCRRRRPCVCARVYATSLFSSPLLCSLSRSKKKGRRRRRGYKKAVFVTASLQVHLLLPLSALQSFCRAGRRIPRMRACFGVKFGQSAIKCAVAVCLLMHSPTRFMRLVVYGGREGGRQTDRQANATGAFRAFPPRRRRHAHSLAAASFSFLSFFAPPNPATN